MEKKGWKTLAIVFICLFIVTIISFIGLLSLGLQEIDRENECSVECSNDTNAGFFDYDYATGICYCINGDSEVIKQIYMG